MKEKVCEKEIMVRLIIYDIHIFFTVKGQGKRGYKSNLKEELVS